MSQFQFLFSLIRRSGRFSRQLLVASMLSGFLQGIMLWVLGASIEDISKEGMVSVYHFLLFALAALCLYKCLMVSMRISSEVARDLVTGFEVRITEKLSKTSYTFFTSIDRSKIYECITGSKDIVNESAIMLPVFICSFTMLACSLGYSFYISPVGALAVVLSMVFAAYLFFCSDKKFINALMSYRKDVEFFQTSLHDVIDGFTELKMNEERRKQLFAKVINPLSEKAIKGRVTADGFRVQNTVMYGLFAYFPSATLLFFLPQTGMVDLNACIKIVSITLFSITPLMGLLSFLPLAARSALIVQQLEVFEKELESAHDSVGIDEVVPLDFQLITIPDARFSYALQENNPNPFSVHVQNFTLRKGELVILRGGNGSGKSTFMKNFAGLIPFTQGDILVDGVPAQEIGYARYRALFSALFPDFHLFTGLYGYHAGEDEVRFWLRRMSLESKITYDAQAMRFSTVSLSSGQRKRMALVCAILEKRPLLLFDEVAADFDHHFREYFYYTLLPELKAENRTMLIISHDDRYFSVADRVVSMQYGKFIED